MSTVLFNEISVNPETLDVPVAATATSDLLEQAFLAAQVDSDVIPEQTHHLYEFDVFAGFNFWHYKCWTS